LDRILENKRPPLSDSEASFDVGREHEGYKTVLWHTHKIDMTFVAQCYFVGQFSVYDPVAYLGFQQGAGEAP